jgi:hypothetical protein
MTSRTRHRTLLYAAGIYSGNLLCRSSPTGCSTEASFESFSTAKVTRITLSSGYTLAAGSGQIVERDGYFAYAAVVPEPATPALVLGGLATLAMSRRRQRNH